jgi:hypothetical protein
MLRGGLVEQLFPKHPKGATTTSSRAPENLERSANDTQYLLSIPGICKSILNGMIEPFSRCVKKITW